MPETTVDPDRFFDSFPRFVETSETGPALERLNARQRVLLGDNADLLAGARVLDLACHDGRFAFAALHHGAAHVVGIDHKAHLLRTAREHLEACGVAPDRYRLLAGDLADCVEQVGPVDVVLCFGILYHLVDHWRLFDDIAALGPRAVIVDTHVSTFDGAVVELRSRLGETPPPPGADIEGFPTRAALEAVVSSFGWTWTYADWTAAGLLNRQTNDYRRGTRVSMVVRCPEADVPAADREAAVAAVVRADLSLEREAIAVAMVAKRYGVAPAALRTWVRHHRCRQAREAGFGIDG